MPFLLPHRFIFLKTPTKMIRRQISNSSTITRCLTSPLFQFSSTREPNPNPNLHKSPIGSPTRIRKLISSQSDPLLAKEIFDYATQQPNFRHSQSSHLILILKLARSNHFNLIDDVLANQNPITGETFTHLIKIYSETKSPEKALQTFHKMLKFNLTPSPKHLNRILEVLVSHRRSYLNKAFELFKISRLHKVFPNTKSYNILMKAFVENDDLSIAYKLFGKMLERDVVPDVTSYRILIQGFCRKGQVNGAMELLEDMLNKGFVPDPLSYTTLLNSLCRKVQLREAYKLLCRMKLKGVHPDMIHYNTMILGFVRENRSMEARKVIDDGNCEPDLVSYRTLIIGLCNEGLFDEGKKYLELMVLRGFSIHFSVSYSLVKGFCKFGRFDEACDVVEIVLRNDGGEGRLLHLETWEMIVCGVCKEDELVKIEKFVDDLVMVVDDDEISGGDTRIVDACGIGFGLLGGYLLSKKVMKGKNVVERRKRHFIGS